MRTKCRFAQGAFDAAPAMMENPIKIMRLGPKQSVDKPSVAA
jgi:hypothetical protein